MTAKDYLKDALADEQAEPTSVQTRKGLAAYAIRMKKNILPALAYISMLLPIFAYKSHHNCMYDECLRIYYDGNFGICIENAIDNICIFLSVLWYIIVLGTCMVLSRNKNTISPFIVIGMIFMLALILPFVDPSKWLFVITLLISIMFFVISIIMDKKFNHDQ